MMRRLQRLLVSLWREEDSEDSECVEAVFESTVIVL